MDALYGIFGIILFIIGIVLIVLWIMMPINIARMTKIVDQQKEISEDILKELKTIENSLYNISKK